MENTILVTADFSGGLDLVFDGKLQIPLQIASGSTVGDLIKKLADCHANNKKEMFYCSQKIKPGILVLVNDVDWQLTDKQRTVLQKGDKISLISTLHGG